MTDTTPDTTTQRSDFPPGSWRIDPTGTTGAVYAKKLGLFTIPATLGVIAGDIEIDDAGHVVSVAVSIDAASYTSNNTARNDVVRGAKFLDTDSHPTIDFSSESIAGDSDSYRADGSVTIKGNKHPATVTITNIRVDPNHATFTAQATLNRSGLGVGALKPIIANRIRLEFNATAHHS